MKTLVTGGAGFIGSHLCEKLLASGHQVTCLDDFNNYYDPNIKRENIAGCREHAAFKLIEGDLLDLPRIRNLFSADKFDIVVHLAAMPGMKQSVQNPFPSEEVNVRGTMNILQTCKGSSAGKFVFASCAAVYGVGLPTPFKESHNVGRPTSPFAATKLAGEATCHAFHHIYGIDMTILRLFTVYGPRQRPEMAIYNFTKQGIEEKVTKRFGDGSTERDFTYIDDAIDAVIKAIEKCEGYEIYNVGSGSSTTVNDLLQLITNALGVELQIEENEPVPGDLPLTIADITKAKLKLGYRPTVNIEDGVRRFVEWMKSRQATENGKAERMIEPAGSSVAAGDSTDGE